MKKVDQKITLLLRCIGGYGDGLGGYYNALFEHALYQYAQTP